MTTAATSDVAPISGNSPTRITSSTHTTTCTLHSADPHPSSILSTVARCPAASPAAPSNSVREAHGIRVRSASTSCVRRSAWSSALGHSSGRPGYPPGKSAPRALRTPESADTGVRTCVDNVYVSHLRHRRSKERVSGRESLRSVRKRPGREKVQNRSGQSEK